MMEILKTMTGAHRFAKLNMAGNVVEGVLLQRICASILSTLK